MKKRRIISILVFLALWLGGAGLWWAGLANPYDSEMTGGDIAAIILFVAGPAWAYFRSVDVV